MKLRYSASSPYVRKVMVMAIETGLEPSIERIAVDPLNQDDVRGSPNPLGKILSLIADG